jgi:hypothetical protein
MVGLSSIVDIGRDKHKHEISPAPVCLVDLVCLVHLVDLVHLVSFVQPNKPDKRDKPNKPRLTGRWPRPYNAVVTCESS